MIRGVIFDLDGTIMDSFMQRVKSWCEALRMNGAEVSEEEIEPLIGTPGVPLASMFTSNPEKVEYDEEVIFAAHIPDLKLFPDVPATLELLGKQGIRYVVVTSSRRKLIGSLAFHLETVITIDDVKQGKPHTDPYEKAMELMGTSPAETLVVGDARVDFIPAESLGCPAIQVTHGRNAGRYTDTIVTEISEIPEQIKWLNSGFKC